MQKLVINNFGPIKQLDLDIKEIMLFIGVQASGKSTVAKTAFFFKSLKDDLYKFLFNSFEKNDFQKPIGNFARVVRQKFLNYYGASTYLSDIQLHFTYTHKLWISIELERTNKYVTPRFSELFKERFNELARKVSNYANKYHSKNFSLLTSNDLEQIESEKKIFFQQIRKECEELFQENRECIFIPAGRSLLAVLSEQLQNIDTRNIDLLTKSFLEKITFIRPFFRKSLRELLIEKRWLFNISPQENEKLNLAIQTIEKILKGEYRSDASGEKIFHAENKYVKLNFASSGQQESLWILLLLFIILSEQKSAFIVIEEPEAHLFPETQKEIINLIALVANQNNSQVMITTHSPYILASFNNLILAHKVGNFQKEKVKEKINPFFWIDSERITAYLLNNGEITNIIDKELKIIQQEQLDTISQTINAEFDFLFQFESEW
ncbi:AAA family ATPase [Raineya orbicola]|jgi:predicted ATPase|uniref:AAA domain n=1 Tax=Raineya orbicola TaxID=2016530 RepID=A0A2N3I9K8_9BACT|nr:AAA family ATPase [Raineya orbicola]PKQ67034.1 AAA domain [Raineya orbicola]